MNGRAFAKVNLSLQVRSVRSDGLHPIRSLAQSVDWADDISLDVADDSDAFEIHGDGLEPDERNLAWRAVTAMRRGPAPPVRLVLTKRIAIAAGLGGGSADAALGLALGATVFGRTPAEAVAAAPDLGADVPFCLAGGTAILSGIGEEIESLPAAKDFALAIVVPPFELATPAVYRRWDELDGPRGPEMARRHVPPSLRDHAPLSNDLQPAALDLAPDLGDWISETATAWGQHVAMSGSGPSLFSFFSSIDEAVDAVGAVRGARAAVAVSPTPVGWELESSGTLPPPPWGVV
jgi:4-diphosphocytidyl-2-C-methyl-D-erythritol kinase